MGERLPQMSSKELIRILVSSGFVIRRITGSHMILRHPITKRMAVVPVHNKDLKRGLVFGILKQAGIRPDSIIV